MRNKKIEVIIFVCVLLVICIPSSFGIYKTTSGLNNLVDIATWNVSLNQNGINGDLEVIPTTDHDTTSYTLNVLSNSEVDIVYKIIISNIPSGVVVKLDEGQFNIPSSGTVIIDPAGTILYSGTHQKTHTLTFKANSGATYVNNQPVTINVEFKQVT